MIDQPMTAEHAAHLWRGDRVRYVGPSRPRMAGDYVRFTQGMTGTVTAVPDGSVTDPRGRPLATVHFDGYAVPAYVLASDLAVTGVKCWRGAPRAGV